jgi:ubiquinone biosynthesis monooxygenase Coq7
MTAMARRIGRTDRLIGILDEGLRTLFAPPRAVRPSPAAGVDDADLSTDDATRSIALMRVNRAGELSAQALYSGQALGARSAATLDHLDAAAADESDHLAWCSDRLRELGGRPSLLDPLWYAGSLFIGIAAGVAGDAASLGFVSETERQVEAHLDDHLGRLPAADAPSRAILEQMRMDEMRHGTDADLAGGRRPGWPIRSLMALGGGILRRSTLYL